MSWYSRTGENVESRGRAGGRTSEFNGLHTTRDGRTEEQSEGEGRERVERGRESGTICVGDVGRRGSYCRSGGRRTDATAMKRGRGRPIDSIPRTAHRPTPPRRRRRPSGGRPHSFINVSLTPDNCRSGKSPEARSKHSQVDSSISTAEYFLYFRCPADIARTEDKLSEPRLPEI